MSHQVYIEEDGELVDVVWYCCDSCARTDLNYNGWSGCHETETNEYCNSCGVVIPGYDDACECQMNNVVVNRFAIDENEICEHGNIIQLARA